MMDSTANSEENRSSAVAPTVSHLFGEMTWLLTQSPLHRALAIGDLDWLLMPPLLHQQFYIFRDAEKPVGLALWAYCSPETAEKLDHGLVSLRNQLTLEDWRSGGQLWLVDLIAPFASEQNQQREIMLADLITGPLAGKEFRFHNIDAATGLRSIKVIPENAGKNLQRYLKNSIKKDAS